MAIKTSEIQIWAYLMTFKALKLHLRYLKISRTADILLINKQKNVINFLFWFLPSSVENVLSACPWAIHTTILLLLTNKRLLEKKGCWSKVMVHTLNSNAHTGQWVVQKKYIKSGVLSIPFCSQSKQESQLCHLKMKHEMSSTHWDNC